MKTSGQESKATVGLNPSASVRTAGANAASKAPAEPAASDHVQLSQLSSNLGLALSGTPAHIAKLSELDRAVSSSQYQPDAHAVSGSIIEHSIAFGAGGYFASSTGR
jgi:hypothetical protein